MKTAYYDYGKGNIQVPGMEVSMRIVVLNGSPHQKGNTKKMIDVFAEGAESTGHQVDVLDVCQKQIGGCMACEYCHIKGKGVCIQRTICRKYTVC